MSALYLIPIVCVVIVATTGSLVAGAIPNKSHQLWTLIISYVLWGLASPLSWIILTMYFLRMAVHTPLQREVIVSLLLPIGPLALSGFSYVIVSAILRAKKKRLTCNRIISLGKLAKKLFLETHGLPHVEHGGDVFYTVGVLVGLLLWGFSIVWFVVAVVMISTVGKFPFNMGWWGFIFPIGESHILL